MLESLSLVMRNKKAAAYYFHHIPKTAGTTLNAALRDIFAPSEICPPFLWSQLLQYNKNELKNFRLFRGHFYGALEPFLGFHVKTFVFLRDPKARALSHYGHVMRAPGHYLHAKAINLRTFEAFLQDPETRETVRNFQSKCLATTFDPKALAARLTDEELVSLKLEEQIETSAPALTSEQLLHTAKAALERFACIGITEHFSQSLNLLGETFGWHLNHWIEPENQNPKTLKSSDLSSKETALLHELNTIDMQLYHEAQSMFGQQLKFVLRK
jgi:hypothetical protein